LREVAYFAGDGPSTKKTAVLPGSLREIYLEAFVDNLINWDHVLKLYEKAS
jgi:hypothetical protein